MSDKQQLDTAREQALKMEAMVNEVVVGQEEAVRLILIALHARGHVLLEGGVGVGKTTLLRAFSKALGGGFGRVEGSVDMMPNDLLYRTWIDAKGMPVIDPGPLVADSEEMAVFFFNEINRARPQVQALLLRVMAERTADAFGKEHEFPHMVVFADRNRVEKEETFELSAAARDRFLFEIGIERPSDPTQRLDLIFDTAFHNVDTLLERLKDPVLEFTDLNDLDRLIQNTIKVSPEIKTYVGNLWNATWEPQAAGIALDDVYMEDLVVAGASVRGMSSMVRAAKVTAWLEG